MSSTVQQSSQAERLEDVAVAGMGADDKGHGGDRLPEPFPHESV